MIKDTTPTVSFIVAAFNEERIIRKKLENSLTLNYPKNLIEIIFVSDGSNDKTESIIKEFEKEQIIGLHKPERQGKTAALIRAVSVAKNDILIFSDANSMFQSDAILKLVRHFTDETIGGVCGRKSVIYNSLRAASLGDKLFWAYESAFKQAESNLSSIPTADGEIFALRKNLYKAIDPKIINDDMALTLNVIKEEKRVIYDDTAITEEEASISLKDDFNVKSRMVYGGLQILSLYKKELNPVRSFFGLQFFIHKTLRYFMWVLLSLILFFNIFLIHEHWFYKLFFFLQILFYFFAIIGFFLNRYSKRNALFYLPYYYCNVNIAAAKGFIFFLKQQSNVDVWKKAVR